MAEKTDERLAALEREIKANQAAQMRILNQLAAGLQSVQAAMTSLTAVVQEHTIMLREQRAGMQALAAGQGQILAIVTGKPKTND